MSRRALASCLIATFSLFHSMSSLSQPLPIEFASVSNQEDFLQNAVYCICQDSRGFLWFGTADGLYRYDGHDFKVYRHNPADLKSLSQGEVFFIHEDRFGALWIGIHANGLNRFNPETEVFDHYEPVQNDRKSLSHYYVYAVCEDPAGALWIGTMNGGLNKLEFLSDSTDERSMTFTRFTHNPDNPNSVSQGWIRALCVDHTGVLWIGTQEHGLDRLVLRDSAGRNPEEVHFSHYQHDPKNPFSLSHNDVRCIYEDHDGVLWIGTGAGGLERFDRQTEQFTHFKHDASDPSSVSDDFVNAICEDNDGRLWIGTWSGGLNLFDRKNSAFVHYKSNPNNPTSLNNDFISALLKDRTGLMWIGSSGGLNKVVRLRSRFSHYFHDPNDPFGLSNNCVNTFCEGKDGALWIGTSDGLDRFDPENKRFVHLEHQSQNANGLGDNYIQAVQQDRTGVLGLGAGYALDRWNQDENRFSHFQFYPGKTDLSVVHAIHHDNKDRVWFGTRGGGIFRADRYMNHLVCYRYDPAKSTGLRSNHVYAIYEDRLGEMWFGTSAGLHRYDDERNGFIPFLMNPRQAIRLNTNFVTTIVEPADSADMSLWVGTRRGGMYRFDRTTGAFQRFTNLRSVCAILEDDHGCLWITGDQELLKFDPQNGSSRSYRAKDGMPIQNFKEGACLKSRKTGFMYFGGTNGFIAFHPDSLKDNPHVPPIFITNFKIHYASVPISADGHSPLSESIITTHEVRLSHKQNTLSFDFAALDYTVPENNQYAYIMEGIDNDWVYAGNRHFANYTLIPPGRYVFRIRGSNNDGIWNAEGTLLRIIIAPPWWRTLWAYALYAALLGLIVTGLWRFQTRRIRLRNELKLKQLEAEKLREVDHIKSRFFANISHEFRTPLTLILGPLEYLLSGATVSNLKEQYRMIFRHGKRLLGLINQLLDLSKLEAGGMILRARPLNIVDALRGMVFSFESLAKRKGVELIYKAQQKEIITYADPDKLEKVISNLLANGLKFTSRGGRVVVSVATVQGKIIDKPNIGTAPSSWVKIEVADTGIGIAPAQLSRVFDRFYQVDDSIMRKHEGTGIGLALTRELVELHHGEIQATSELNRGTVFSIFLPLGKEHLKDEEIVGDKESADQEVLEHRWGQEIIESSSEQTNADLKCASKSSAIVLVVDDNADMRSYLCSNLSAVYRVREAKDGMEALAHAVAKIPDLIISDVMMPNMDGFELCEKIKTDERTSHIPVILVTARASEKSKLEGLETGADDYITKPFSVQELQVRVRNLIEQRRKLRERFSRDFSLRPKDIAITSVDERFVERAMEVMESYMDDPEFDTQMLARKLGMSRMQLHRKLCALTDQTPRQFIRILRLRRAAQLLHEGAGNVTEVAYMVGFNNISHFAKRFRELHGQSPSEFAKIKL